MAVTLSYTLSYQYSLNPRSIESASDAASLANGGVAVSGQVGSETSATSFDAFGIHEHYATVDTGVDPSISQFSNGDIVVATDGGTDILFTILRETTGLDLYEIVPTAGIGESGPNVLNPDVAGGLTGGRFVIAYQNFFGGTDNDINLEIRTNGGDFVTNFSVDGTAANDQKPSVATLDDGGFAVGWHRVVGANTQLWYAVYNGDGTTRAAPTLLDNAGTINRNASVVALDSGGFAIAYEDNGGTGGETDITLARLTAGGTFIDQDDIAPNLGNDTAPSTTVLSNGMIVVGSTNDAFGDTDPVWTLVDQNTGAVLGVTRTGFTLNDDSQTTVAGMTHGEVATFFTDAGAGTVVGQVLVATRISFGDGADDTITGDDLHDIISGGDGNDIIRGGFSGAYLGDELHGDAGSDTFIFAHGEAGVGEVIGGGAGFDRILVRSSVNFIDHVTLAPIEKIEFSFGKPGMTVSVLAEQIGAGLAADLVVKGDLNGVADTLRILMNSDIDVDLSAFQFVNFDTGAAEGDRIEILGYTGADIIVGSAMRDDITGYTATISLPAAVGSMC